MAAEHAAIRVQLVDDDELEVLEELRPSRMVRQDARVQHVGVAQHDVRARAHRTARVLRRVAVIGEDADVAAARAADALRQLMELGQLILRQRFRRKEIQRSRRRVAQDAVENRRVVTEGLARRRRRDDDGVPAGERVVDGLGLVKVELVDPAHAERVLEAGIESVRKRREDRRCRREPLDRRDVGVVVSGPRGGLVRRQHPRQGQLQGVLLVRRHRRQ